MTLFVTDTPYLLKRINKLDITDILYANNIISISSNLDNSENTLKIFHKESIPTWLPIDRDKTKRHSSVINIPEKFNYISQPD